MNNIKNEFELSKKNVFEELFELIERNRLDFKRDFSLENFYEVLESFDKAIQQFNSENKNYNNVRVINNILERTFNNFLVIFRAKGFNNEPIFYAFKRFIAFFSFVINEIDVHKNSEDIKRSFFENFPSLLIDISTLNKESQDLYLGLISKYSEKHNKILKFEDHFSFEIGIDLETIGPKKPIIVYTNEFIAKSIEWDEQNSLYIVIDQKYYMFVDIVVDSEEQSAEQMLRTVWLLTSALESIQNVNVKIESIKKGSLKLKLRVWINDLVANEETKAVLETMKETVIKTVTSGQVSYSDIKKSRLERKQQELENKKLEQDLNQLPSDTEVKLDRAIEMEKKVLENEKLEIENAQAKLAIIEKLSDLAAKGILDADMVRIDINSVLYILKDKDQISEIGPDISEIS